MAMTGLWKYGRFETAAMYLLAAIGLLIAIILLGDEVVSHIRAFETWIEGLGMWAFIVYALIYAFLSSLLFPESLLGIIAGAAFGFSAGLLTIVCGSLLGVMIQYALARSLLRPTIERNLSSRPNLVAVQRAVLQQQIKLQMLIRLTPINRAMSSYALGAAGVRFLPFVGACLAILPNLCLEIYFGYAGKHLAQAGQPGHGSILHDAVLAVGFMIAALVVVQVSRTARRAIEQASGSSLNEARA